jgi:hypothetical protein
MLLCCNSWLLTSIRSILLVSAWLQLVDAASAVLHAAALGFFARSWLQQQPEFQHMRVLLRGLPPPSAMDTHIAALPSPLLRLRVVQLKLWKVRPP